MSTFTLAPVELTQAGINELYDTFGSGTESTVDGVTKFMPIDEIIARDVVSKAAVQAPGLFDYNNLLDGTAPFFDQIPAFANLSAAERKFKSNDEIIEFLARDEKGQKLIFGDFKEGFKRDVIPQLFSLTGAVTGAKIGAKIPAPSAPFKFGVTLGSTILGAFGAYEGGDLLTSELFGDERTILPGTRKAYAQGKTAAGVFSWLPTPFLISKNVDFGAAKYLDNLVEVMKKGPVTATDFQNKDVAKSLARGKGPNLVRLVNGIEKMLSASSQFARKSPKTTLAVEGIAGVSQTGFAGVAEESFPGQADARIMLESGGSIVPGVAATLLVDRASAIMQALKNAFGRTKQAVQDKEGTIRAAKEGLGFIKERQRQAGAKKILELLEEQGEIDPAYLQDQTKFDALIKKLSELDKTDPNFDVELTAGLKANSPVLISVEAALAQTNRGLGKQQKSAIAQQGQAIRNVIVALVKTGDRDAIKEAMKLSEALFSDAIALRLKNATAEVLSSFSKVKGDEPELNSELGQKLFEMVKAQQQLGRATERSNWQKVKSVELTKFVDGEGNELDAPNFIKLFQDRFTGPDVPTEYREFFAKNLKPLFKFANRKSNELGFGDLIDPKLLDEGAGAGVSKSDVLEAEMQDLVREFDITVAGQQKNRLQTEIDNVNDRIIDYKDDEDFAKKALSYLKSNEPVKIDTARKGFTRDQVSGFTKTYENNMKIHKAALKYYNKLLKQAKLNKVVETEDVLPDEPGIITSGELVKMRSLALGIQRGLSGPNGNAGAANFAGDFAKAILNDLNSFDEGINIDYDNARAYSNAFNKVYTDTFAGDIIAKTSRGKIKNNPETLAEKLLGGSADATNLRVKQIQNIGVFAKENNLQGAEELPNSITGVLELILRNARAAAIDPTTGTLNEKALGKWMEANKELLDNQAFQGLRDDLSNLDTAVATLSTVKEKNKNLLKKLNDQVFFAKNASGKNIESPVLIAGNAIAGKNPTRDLRNLSRIAKASKNPESALGGLYSSILEYAMTKAGGTSQAFSPRTFYDTVFSEMPNAIRRTNLAEMMVSNGIATQKQMDSVKKFVTELVKFEAMEAAGKFGDKDLVENINGLLGFYLKISGASVGQFIASKMPLPGSRGMGTGLIESQAGVQIMENIFRDVPQSMKMDVMAELMADPVRLAQMLQKVRTQQQAKTTFESLSNWLRSSGFKPIKRIAPAVIREIDEEITGPEFEFEESSVNLPKAGFPTTQKATVPQSGVNARLAANVGTAPQAAPNPNQRQQFASLFPNDPISGLINAQQPPRLMAEGGAVPPRQVDIQGQPHMLAYITPQEGGILQLLGGSGAPGPMGIPSFAFGDPDAGADESQPGGPSDDGSDNNNENYGSYADDTSGFSTVGIDSSYSPSVGGDTGYSGSITSAMADTSPTGMTGIGGIGGGSGGFGVTSTGMGLDDLGIADQVGIMGGLSKGVKDLQTMQGSSSYAPVTNVPYDIFGFVKGAMNRHARDSLRKGYSPEFTYDEKGRITSVTGKGGPGVSIPGVGSLMSMIGANMGGITTTGYDPSVIGGSGGDDNGGGIATLPAAPISPTQAKKADTGIVSPLDIYLANVDKYRVRGM